MSRSVRIILLGLLALLVLWLLCLRCHGAGIEVDLCERTRTALAAEGLIVPGCRADGRDLRLAGEVTSEAERTRAAEIARSIYGVRVVDNQLSVAAPPPPKPVVAAPRSPYRTRLDFGEDGIRLTGSAPDEDARGKLRELAEERVGENQVQDALALRGDAPEGWSAAMSAVAARLGDLQTVRVTLVDRKLGVTGTAKSVEAREAALVAIRAALPAGFDASLDLATPGVACQKRFDDALGSAKIRFATAKATIASESHALLDRLAAISGECPEASFRIEGHTDSVGSEAANERLSQARATSVRRYLVSKGVVEDRMRAVGRGEADPVADNETAAGRARNRRIELRVEGE